MRSLQVSPHCSSAVVQKNLSDSRGTRSHSRWQIIYLIEVGNLHAAELIPPLVNLSVHSIYKIVEAYNKQGAPALIAKQKGGRRRSLLSVCVCPFFHCTFVISFCNEWFSFLILAPKMN